MEDVTEGKVFLKELPVPLTVEERLQISDEMARAVHNMGRIEAARKEAAAEYAARYKQAQATVEELSLAISNGYVHRMVDVYWEYHWNINTKLLFRVGTFEQVKTEAITLEDRQRELNLKEQELKDAAEEAAPPEHEKVLDEPEDKAVDSPGEVENSSLPEK